MLQRLKNVDLSEVNLDILIDHCPEIPIIYLKVLYLFYNSYHDLYFVF